MLPRTATERLAFATARPANVTSYAAWISTSAAAAECGSEDRRTYVPSPASEDRNAERAARRRPQPRSTRADPALGSRRRTDIFLAQFNRLIDPSIKNMFTWWRLFM